jgi:hypothetical protein
MEAFAQTFFRDTRSVKAFVATGEMWYEKQTCCEKLRRLKECFPPSYLLPEIWSLVCSYVTSHNLVKPKSTGCISVMELVNFKNTFPITFDALEEGFKSGSFRDIKITDWKWHLTENEDALTVIHVGKRPAEDVKADVGTRGTILELHVHYKAPVTSMMTNELVYIKRRETFYATELTAADEVRVVLFLHQYGLPAVHHSLCPIYREALMYPY